MGRRGLASFSSIEIFKSCLSSDRSKLISLLNESKGCVNKRKICTKICVKPNLNE